MAIPGCHRSLQGACYSGHRRMHCLIYLTLSTPDGLIFPLHGPEVGERHDLTLYRESNRESTLQNYLNIEDEQYCIYGYLANLPLTWMLRPFYSALATLEQAVFSTAMSAVWLSVEHNYKDLKQYCTSQECARNLPSPERADSPPLKVLCVTSQHARMSLQARPSTRDVLNHTSLCRKLYRDSLVQFI